MSAAVAFLCASPFESTVDFYKQHTYHTVNEKGSQLVHTVFKKFQWQSDILSQQITCSLELYLEVYVDACLAWVFWHGRQLGP